jgi:hypothetical protein
VLYQALIAAKKQPNGEVPSAAFWDSIEGEDYLDEVVLVDQSPIGRTPRSNPVTYIKAFDAIRDLFASLPEAQKRGFGAGHFSFNIPGGRCETCQGDGTVTVEMQFLADVELVCEECKGTRYSLRWTFGTGEEHPRSSEPDRKGSASSLRPRSPRSCAFSRGRLDICGWDNQPTLRAAKQRMKLAAHLRPTGEIGRPSTNGAFSGGVSSTSSTSLRPVFLAT